MAGPDRKISELNETSNSVGGFFEIILPDGSGGFESWRISVANSVGNSMNKTVYDPRNIAKDVFNCIWHTYDNAASGLSATDVQNGIDELADAIDQITEGEANTGSNLGTGQTIFVGKTGVDFEFRTLKQGANISITQDADGSLIIAASGGSGSDILVYDYTLNGSTFDADPGAGLLRLNDADPNLATFIYISNFDLNNLTVGARYATLQKGERVVLEKSGDKTRSYLFTLTDDAEQATGYVKLPVEMTDRMSTIAVGDNLKAAISYGGGGEASVQTEFTTTVDGITIPAGTTVLEGTLLEDLWKAELAPYVAPEFTSFTIGLTPNPSFYEVGATATVDDANVAVQNDSEGNPPQNIFIAGVGFNKAGAVGVTPADPASTVQKTDDETEQWTVSGEDKDSNPIPISQFSKVWRYRAYFGANATELTTGSLDSEVQAVMDALQQDQLQADKASGVTCGSYNATIGNYTYYIYANKYGALAGVILNGASPVLGAFEDLGSFTVNNGEGQAVSVRVYKSNADGAFANGDTLDFS